MYVFTHTYMYIYMCVSYICVHIYLYIYTYIYIYVCVCTHTHMHAYQASEIEGDGLCELFYTSEHLDLASLDCDHGIRMNRLIDESLCERGG